MRAIICDMCERRITDQDVQNKRQETNYEIHVVECEHEPEGEIRTNYDLCYGCLNKIKKIVRDPQRFNQWWMSEFSRRIL